MITTLHANRKSIRLAVINDDAGTVDPPFFGTVIASVKSSVKTRAISQPRTTHDRVSACNSVLKSAVQAIAVRRNGAEAA